MVDSYIFKGSNGSMGYRTGRLYELYVSIFNEKLGSIYISPISRSSRSEKACIYQSQNSFEKNWKKVIRVFNEMDPYGEEIWEQ